MNYRTQQEQAIVNQFSPKDGSGCLGRRARYEINKLRKKWDKEHLEKKVPELYELEKQRDKMWKYLTNNINKE